MMKITGISMMKMTKKNTTIIDSVIGWVSILGYGGSIPPHPLVNSVWVDFNVATGYNVVVLYAS
jgi:hypothetical protein